MKVQSIIHYVGRFFFCFLNTKHSENLSIEKTFSLFFFSVNSADRRLCFTLNSHIKNVLRLVAAWRNFVAKKWKAHSLSTLFTYRKHVWITSCMFILKRNQCSCNVAILQCKMSFDVVKVIVLLMHVTLLLKKKMEENKNFCRLYSLFLPILIARATMNRSEKT